MQIDWHELRQGLKGGALIGLAAAAMALPSMYFVHRHYADQRAAVAAAAPRVALAASPVPTHIPRDADFGDAKPSADAKLVADWVSQTGDNAGGAFVILDKKLATLYVFDADGKLKAHTPVLLGQARTDDTVPGIGQRPLDQVKPEERTTPAGRFVAERGRNSIGEDVVWVDYDAAVSMHRVRTTNPKEHRLERLASPTIADNRISWGCINIPKTFFETYVAPPFVGRRNIVYVLPDVKPVREVFGIPETNSRQAQVRLPDTRRLS